MAGSASSAAAEAKDARVYTQCPECGTVFRITAAVLRAAQAQVRCGVCDANFNALLFLSDDLDAGVTPATTGAVAANVSEPVAEFMAAGDATPDAARDAEPGPAPEPEPEPEQALEPTAEPELAQPAPPQSEPVPAPELWPGSGEPPHATRTTPSADESRAFEELTASLAAASAAADAEPADPFNVLEPDDVDELLLEGAAPDQPPEDGGAALEFNAPPADWERIFIAGDEPVPVEALDLSLGPTAGDPGDPGHETLLLEPEPDAEAEAEDEAEAEAEPEADPNLPDASAGDARPYHVLDELPASEPDLVLQWLDDGTAEPAAEPTPPPPAHAADAAETVAEAPVEDEFDVELDLRAALEPMRPANLSESWLDDPLAQTDEFPLPDFSVPPPGLDATENPAADDADDPGHADASGAAFAAAPGHAGFEQAAEPDVDQFDLGSGSPEPTPISADEFRPRTARPARAPAAPPAVAAAIALALLLAGQLVHHAREPLIDTPIVGPPLAALYRALGAPVEPRWNLAAYEVRQWGAASDATPGMLRLRASIVNRAGRAQPYPLLRVVLEDRYGGAVARREFRPQEYLPGHAAPATPLGAGARADADLRLIDPGSEVVGFELDVCLERRGALVCGTDPRPPEG